MNHSVFFLFLFSFIPTFGMTNEAFFNQALRLLSPLKRKILSQQLQKNEFFYIENAAHLKFIAYHDMRNTNPEEYLKKDINNSCVWTGDGEYIHVQVRSDVMTMHIDEIKGYLSTKEIDTDFFAYMVKKHLDFEMKSSLQKFLLSKNAKKKNLFLSNQDFEKQRQLLRSAYMISCDSGWDLSPAQQENALKEINRNLYALTPIYVRHEIGQSQISITFKDQELPIDIATARTYFSNH